MPLFWRDLFWLLVKRRCNYTFPFAETSHQSAYKRTDASTRFNGFCVAEGEFIHPLLPALHLLLDKFYNLFVLIAAPALNGDRCAKGHMDFFGGVNPTKFFDKRANPPSVGLQGQRNDRHIGALGELDTDGIKLLWFKGDCACGLGKDDNRAPARQ